VLNEPSYVGAVAGRDPDDEGDHRHRVSVHDHIIVRKNGHASMKELKLI
jgi:hypothetical protein